MFLKSQPLSVKIGLTFLSMSVIVLLFGYALRSVETVQNSSAPVQAPVVPASRKPEHVRGIHLTSWFAGSKKGRERIEPLLKESEINSVVIAVKEYEGEVYVPGVPLAEKYHAYVKAVPDLPEYVARLKQEGLYTIARVVVFKDNILPRKKPELAIKRPDGSIWSDRHNIAWLDPYNHEAWDYIISIASRSAAAGFDEIQFDYIRFPSDGDTKQCRYSYAQHNSSHAAQALDHFLEYASGKLKPMGVNLSIDIFGLTPSVKNDMGIGQKIMGMTPWVDFVSPMTYPSHYAKGEYGIADPNRAPYRVVHKTMYDAKNRLGDLSKRLRPYLQDFSLGYHYGPKEVRAQIEACEDQGILDWLLWNPNCHYQRAALRSKDGKLSPEAQVPESWKAEPARKGKKAGEASGPTAAAPQSSTGTPSVAEADSTSPAKAEAPSPPASK